MEYRDMAELRIVVHIVILLWTPYMGGSLRTTKPPTIQMCSSGSTGLRRGQFYLVTPGYPNYNPLSPHPIGCQCEMSVPQDDHIQVSLGSIQLQNRRQGVCSSEYMMTTSRVLTMVDGQYDDSIRYCHDHFPIVSRENNLVHAYVYDPTDLGRRGRGARHLIKGIPQKCNHGWNLYDDVCYRIMTSPGNITIDVARNKCELTGASLTVFHNKKQETYYRRYLHGYVVLLLGATQTGGEWRWPDGTSVKYASWGPDPPTKSGKCAILDNFLGRWEAVACDRIFPQGTKYVCQKNTTVSAPRQPPAIKMTCKKLVVPIPDEGSTSDTSTTTELPTVSTTQETTPNITKGAMQAPISKKADNNVGLIAGMSVLAVALLVVLIFGFVLYRRKKAPSPNTTQDTLPSSASLNFVRQKEFRQSVKSDATEYQNDEDDYNYIDHAQLDGYAVGGHMNDAFDVSIGHPSHRKGVDVGYIIPIAPNYSGKGPDVDLSRLPVAPKPPGYPGDVRDGQYGGLTVNMPRAHDNDYMDSINRNIPASPYTRLTTSGYDQLSSCYSEKLGSDIDPSDDNDGTASTTTGSSELPFGYMHPPRHPTPTPPPYPSHSSLGEDIEPSLPTAPFPTLPDEKSEERLDHTYYNDAASRW